MDCLFCKIVNGDIPSYKIYEDDKVIAFLDIHPRNNGHTLLIPKKHYTDFSELDDEILLHLHKITKNIVNVLREKLGSTGFCINTNYLDTQEIKHFHLHIVPSGQEKILEVEKISYEVLYERK